MVKKEIPEHVNEKNLKAEMRNNENVWIKIKLMPSCKLIIVGLTKQNYKF